MSCHFQNRGTLKPPKFNYKLFLYGHIDDHLKSILSYALDENLDFVHVGNLYDRARFSTHFLCLHTNVRKSYVYVSRTCRKS